MVESNGERKIPTVLLSYVQHGIKTDNSIESLKPSKRPWDKFKVTQGSSVSSSMYLQPQRDAFLESTDEINNKCPCTSSTVRTNVRCKTKCLLFSFS